LNSRKKIIWKDLGYRLSVAESCYRKADVSRARRTRGNLISKYEHIHDACYVGSFNLI